MLHLKLKIPVASVVSYHTGHLRITKSYGNPPQLPEKGAKNVYLGI